MKVAQIRRFLSAREKQIAKERDKLRAKIDEMEELEEVCNEAVEHIQRAVDSLSKVV